ncbi:MAG: hypothetical protein EBV86_03210 [Marivivens sp.]|nr:hypothetical protein [Marivivens sp.]
MGLYGSPPPPPPDYTKDILIAQGAMNAANKAKADTYNKAVDDFNANVANYANNALSDWTKTNLGENYQGGFTGFLGGLGIEDLYDDPNTPQNEAALYNSAYTALGDTRDYLSGLQAPDKPTFETFKSGGPWSASVSAPSLSTANISGLDSSRDIISGYLGQLDDLKTSRAAEEKRIGDFRSNFLEGLGDLGIDANQLNIANVGGMDRLERDIATAQSRLGGFSSSILDQIAPDFLTNQTDALADLSEQLSGLRTDRQSELDRISGFETGVLDLVDDYQDRIGDLDISNIDELNTIKAAIDAKQKEAGRFSSLLGFDFGDELGELRTEEGRVDKLLREREDELDRIAGAQDRASSEARALASLIGDEGLDYSSKAALDAYKDRYDAIQEGISGFSSLLDFDFSGADADLASALGGYNTAVESRKEAIDDLMARATGATSGLADVNLYDEQAIRDYYAANDPITEELAKYTGGRVSDVRDQLKANTDAVDARLKELSDKRNEFETQARELEERLRSTDYYTSAEAQGGIDELARLKDQIDLYNAQQALDEYDSSLAFLQDQKNRLLQDEANVQRREEAERQRVAATIGPSGVPTVQDLALMDPVTRAQYLAIMQGMNDDEEEETPLSLNPFSSNLSYLG